MVGLGRRLALGASFALFAECFEAGGELVEGAETIGTFGGATYRVRERAARRNGRGFRVSRERAERMAS